LNIQDYQNAYHNHSFTPAGSISIKTNPTFTGTAVTSGGASTETVTITDPGHKHTSSKVNYGSAKMGVDSWGQTNGWTQSGPTFTDTSSATTGITAKHAHTHSVTADGTISGGAYTFTGTAGNTGYNGNSSIKETRPSNYSYVIWKRIA